MFKNPKSVSFRTLEPTPRPFVTLLLGEIKGCKVRKRPYKVVMENDGLLGMGMAQSSLGEDCPRYETKKGCKKESEDKRNLRSLSVSLDSIHLILLNYQNGLVYFINVRQSIKEDPSVCCLTTFLQVLLQFLKTSKVKDFSRHSLLSFIRHLTQNTFL